MGLAVAVIFMMALVIHSICAQTVDLLCTEQFCMEQTTQFPCNELPDECSDSSTMNGIILPDPSLCNCCDYCIVYLEEGDDCVLNGQGQPVHEAVCGPGLWCMKESDSDSAACVPLISDCTNEQRDYDQARENGSLGFTRVRPLCDERGDYLPAHCIGGSVCYCVNPQGERIFGEQVYSASSLRETMTCECSLAAWKAEQLATEMEVYLEPIHCLEDGSYDPLQCNDGMCRCLLTGSNIPSADYPVHEINIMEDNPVCFDHRIHQTGKYKRECEEKASKIMQDRINLLSEGIFPVGLRLPNCQYDGRYNRVKVTDTEKICVDPDGNSLGYSVLRNNTLSNGMDCNCARTSFLLKQVGETELPICCDNGNFRRMQCRRGLCYCVDCNGNQLGIELDEAIKDELKCDDSCSICEKPKQELKKQSSIFKWNSLESEEISLYNF
ncbi:thyroglobulin-like isoform X2 [Zootermopsis nevadensis]|nr:thyroglobulin-like isoform X2 [Zootermopsis nevadensis]XP_021934662.1 thyroglobulin-like isoform X2 [Zootermopsis nevadensis]